MQQTKVVLQFVSKCPHCGKDIATGGGEDIYHEDPTCEAFAAEMIAAGGQMTETICAATISNRPLSVNTN